MDLRAESSSDSESISTQSLISRRVHSLQLEVLALQERVTALEALSQVQQAQLANLETRFSCFERIVQAVRCCFA